MDPPPLQETSGLSSSNSQKPNSAASLSFGPMLPFSRPAVSASNTIPDSVLTTFKFGAAVSRKDPNAHLASKIQTINHQAEMKEKAHAVAAAAAATSQASAAQKPAEIPNIAMSGLGTMEREFSAVSG